MKFSYSSVQRRKASTLSTNLSKSPRSFLSPSSCLVIFAPVRTDCLIPIGRRRDRNPRAIPIRPSRRERRGERSRAGDRSSLLTSLSCPLSNSILEGSSGASVTNGRSSSETIVCIRGRLKPISPEDNAAGEKEGGRERGRERGAVSFGIRSLIAETGRGGGGRNRRLSSLLRWWNSSNIWFESVRSKSRIPEFRWLGSVNCSPPPPIRAYERSPFSPVEFYREGRQIFFTFKLTCNSPPILSRETRLLAANFPTSDSPLFSPPLWNRCHSKRNNVRRYANLVDLRRYFTLESFILFASKVEGIPSTLIIARSIAFSRIFAKRMKRLVTKRRIESSNAQRIYEFQPSFDFIQGPVSKYHSKSYPPVSRIFPESSNTAFSLPINFFRVLGKKKKKKENHDGRGYHPR